MKEITIELDKTSKVKLYHQLYQFFANLIENGELPIGEKLPSIRTLSVQHEIARNTVTNAYNELEKKGYIYSVAKSGYFVKDPKEKNISINKNVSSTKTLEEQSEFKEIPTVDFILKNSKNTSFTHTIETADLVQDDINAFAEEKENSLLFNSGDIIQSKNSNEKIISPMSAFIDSCITALAEHHNRLESDKKTDIQGETPLRVAIAAFIYKYNKININPTQVILNPNVSYSFFNLFQLDEIKNPSKSIHGLLQLAENSISQDPIIPIIAITNDINQNIIGAIKATGIKTIIIDPNIENLASYLNSIKATCFIFSTRSLNLKNITQEKKELLLKWLKTKSYRYFIVYDNISENQNYNSIDDESMLEQCIYINSFSKLISKNICTSFTFLPKHLVESYNTKFKDFDSPVSMILQCGLVDFLIKGKLFNYLTSLEIL